MQVCAVWCLQWNYLGATDYYPQCMNIKANDLYKTATNAFGKHWINSVNILSYRYRRKLWKFFVFSYYNFYISLFIRWSNEYKSLHSPTSIWEEQHQAETRFMALLGTESILKRRVVHLKNSYQLRYSCFQNTIDQNYIKQ